MYRFRYIIFDKKSGKKLGEYVAETPREALELLAKDAGYKDYDELRAKVSESYRDTLRIRAEPID